MKYKDIQSCQLFANICLFHLYDETKSVCNLYKNNQGSFENIPTIYYPDTHSSKDPINISR